MVTCRSGPPVDGPKDPWRCVLSLPERFVGDPASLARDNIMWKAEICHENFFPSTGFLTSLLSPSLNHTWARSQSRLRLHEAGSQSSESWLRLRHFIKAWLQLWLRLLPVRKPWLPLRVCGFNSMWYIRLYNPYNKLCLALASNFLEAPALASKSLRGCGFGF